MNESLNGKTEARLRHLNAVLRSIRNVNQLITQTTDRNSLLHGACQNLVIDRGYHHAWVILTDQTGQPTAIESAGLAAQARQAVDRFGDAGLPACARRAWAEPGVKIIEQPETTCNGCALLNSYAGRSSMSVRLEHQGRRYGLVTVSVPTAFAQDPEEIDLLAEVAGDIAFALYKIDLEDQRRQAETMLRESRRQYKMLFDSMLEAYALHQIICDSAGVPVDYRFLEINPAFEQMTGLRRDIIGKTVLTVLPNTEAHWIETYGRVALTGQPLRFENIATALESRWFEVLAFSPASNQFATIFRDITERKKNEAELHSRNQELSLLNRVLAVADQNEEPGVVLQAVCRELAQAFNLGQVNAMLMDETKRTVNLVAEFRRPGQPALPDMDIACSVANDPAARDQFRQKSPVIISNLQNSPHLALYYEQFKLAQIEAVVYLPLVIESRTIGSVNLCLKHADALLPEEVDLAWRITNQVAGVLAKVRLNQKHQRLSATVEQVGESVLITDLNGDIIYVNPAFSRIAGYSQAEVIGRNPRLLKSGKQDDLFYREMWAVITAGQVWHGRLINKKKNGDLFTEDATISPVRDRQGNIINYVAVKHDITRELQLEAQYHQAQKMESLGRLTGGVAHDFNNLLTAINGFAELAQMRLHPGDPLYQMVGNILNSGQRAADLVRQLLVFSRKQAVEPKILDINQTVTNLEKMMHRIIGEDVHLKINLSPHLPAVQVDPTQVEQIILNLAVNARDAMPEGGQLIIETAEVKLAQMPENNLETLAESYTRLSVSDNGMGIAEKDLPYIFEPFYTTKEQGKGTGLGLATVYGIVKQNNGDIQVVSVPGVGTTFYIYLPCVKSESAPVNTGGVLAIPTGHETILLVEDDEEVRGLVRDVLQQLAYRVLIAENGETALRLATIYNRPIHLVLTDVVMSGINGKILVEKLRKIRSDFKVIYMSGYADNVITLQGVINPDIAFIQKPFSSAELGLKIRAVLDEITP